MKVAVTGATGFVGRNLIAMLQADGIETIPVSRDPQRAREQFPSALRVLEWAPPAQGLAPDALEGVDAVVHLAGATIAQRWSARIKREIRESRIRSTRLLVEAIEQTSRRPGVLVSMSAVGFYGAREDDAPLTEDARPGNDFLADLCLAWEQEAGRAEASGVRVVNPRAGIVLGAGGGALTPMLLPFRLGLGGPIGSGRQWMSWIHVRDLAGLICHAIQNPAVSGPMNATAPHPVRNREFSTELGKALHRPAVLPIPVFGLKLLYGEFANVLATGQRVIPEKALNTSYGFQFPELGQALTAALRS